MIRKLKIGKKSGLRLAKQSVATAAKFFEDKGFTVFGLESSPSANGVDLFIARKGVVRAVEVKSVVHSTRAFRVKPCSNPTRCDFIAMVYGERVIVQPMGDHLLCCSKDGSRAVTKLIEATL